MTESKRDTLLNFCDVDEWMFKFEIHASANNLDESKQSSLAPAFFSGRVLDLYLKSGIHPSPPFASKLKKIFNFLRSKTSTHDLMSSSYRDFESANFAPGEDLSDFVGLLSDLLEKARPSINEADRNFIVIQKLPQLFTR
ncbi:hypothetical protein RF11_13226 [Thelohanellus kitauei]|uniref:Uncharacterized protein n=1 Tax=Thelohanellus kitauei TaxID=669202 RepID=A0A0C2IZI8_THEKT|nr:hypothetical protein RF11_13226 [Thelohanellus kitauei]